MVYGCLWFTVVPLHSYSCAVGGGGGTLAQSNRGTIQLRKNKLDVLTVALGFITARSFATHHVPPRGFRQCPPHFTYPSLFPCAHKPLNIAARGVSHLPFCVSISPLVCFPRLIIKHISSQDAGNADEPSRTLQSFQRSLSFRESVINKKLKCHFFTTTRRYRTEPRFKRIATHFVFRGNTDRSFCVGVFISPEKRRVDILSENVTDSSRW